MKIIRVRPGLYITEDGLYEMVRTRENSLHATETAWFWRNTATGEHGLWLDTLAQVKADLEKRYA